ncbi:MAG: nitroreductase family protein [Lawsonibacter sp.]|nr:nitroreductase family protein [Lawsonibacter sp.]
MDTQTCILTRRSVRNYTQEPVSHALLAQIVSLASYAPSWKNTQITRYLAIEDPTVRQDIIDRFCLPGSNNPSILSSAPLLVAQTFVKSRSGFERDGTYSTDREAGWQYYDCGISAQTFCLAAHDLGLATVIMGVFDRKGLEAYLQIPEDQELMALIALGHAAEIGPAPKRKDVDVLLSYR